MDWLLYEFNQRAVLGALCIGFANGFLGGYVLLRRSSLFASALSHTVFPGIALGALVAGLNPISALIGALIAAMAIGLSAQSIAAYSRLDHNTTLAILFTAAFGGGLLILDSIGLYINIEEYLFGELLGMSHLDLWFSYLAGGVTVLTLLLLQRPLMLFLLSPQIAASVGVPTRRMDLLLAFLIILIMVCSMQAVGVILTLGLMITPPAILVLFTDRPGWMFWGGGLTGAAVSFLALMLTNWLDWQTGATIVVCLGGLFLAAFAVSPKYGLWALVKARTAHQHSDT